MPFKHAGKDRVGNKDMARIVVVLPVWPGRVRALQKDDVVFDELFDKV